MDYSARMKNIFRPQLESCESRDLLSPAPLPFAAPGVNPQTPHMIHVAYDLVGKGLEYPSESVFNKHAGAGITYGIVDAFADPNIVAEVHAFDGKFDLPDPPSFKEVHPDGFAPYDPNWGVEEALDVEWVHAMAPQANILYVGAGSASGPSLLNANTVAANRANVVTDSWGAPAFAGDSGLGFFFQPSDPTKNVTFTASAGDSPALYFPAHLKNFVVSIAGTTLNDAPFTSIQPPAGTYFGARNWPLSGLQGQVSAAADPLTGAAVFCHIPGRDVDGAFYVVGGTSWSSPVWAGLIGLADQERYYTLHMRILSTQDVTNALKVLPDTDWRHGHGIQGRGEPIASKLVPDLAKTRTAKVTHQIHQAPPKLPVFQPFAEVM